MEGNENTELTAEKEPDNLSKEVSVEEQYCRLLIRFFSHAGMQAELCGSTEIRDLRMCRSEANRSQRYLNLSAKHIGKAPETKDRPWKPKSTEGTSSSGVLGNEDCRSGGTSSTADKKAGKSAVAQNKLLEYPPLGEVQLRGLHSNARSLMKIRGRRSNVQ